MSKKHRIAVIAGDGIGKEVMPEGLRVLQATASKFNIDLQFDHFDFSSWDYYEKHGQMLPDNWKEQIGGHDAIYFGAVGQCFDVLALWHERATQVTGEALPCGHYLAEELPEAVAAQALNFFQS